MDHTRKALPKPKTYEGLSAYRPPLCFELVGKTYELVMDNGYKYKYLPTKYLEYFFQT